MSASKPIAALSGVLFAASVCTHPPHAYSQSAPPGRTLVEQKESLVRRLLTDSPAEARIFGGSNAEAKEHFRSARASHESAVKRIADADFPGAEQDLNKAMWLAGKAHQLVPDPMRRAIELRVQNAGMTRSIESLRVSYEGHLARVRGLPRGARTSDPIIENIAAGMERARSFANSEHVEEANAVLHALERELMRALGTILGSTTIEYAQRFETLAEEFAYEADRNRSYEELIPLARQELRPAREAQALMQRCIATNNALAEQARKLAAGRQYSAAIETMRNGTTYLQAALGAAGLVVPRED